MRLRTLDLLRYGHLTDVRLAFPDAAGLHVVLGANEAGKSTALAAIGDALFGFPHITPFAFQHATAELRIAFEVAAEDGTRAAFIRQKRRKDALLDAAENPVPETALARFLGGAGRELFQNAFGLNAASLRDGSRSLIEGGGAAGEALFAGMGLPHLRRALERLEKAADELHGTKHKARRLARAAEDFQVAERNLQQAAVKPAEWTEAQAALERVGAELAAIAAEAAALKKEEVRLRRARGVRPILKALARLRSELEPVADAPVLPAEAGASLARLTAALDKAAGDGAREAEAAARLEAELAALHRDPMILDVQDPVDALAELRAAAAGAERDLPGVRRVRDAEREKIAQAAARLGLDGTPEEVRAALPAEGQRIKAQRLIRGRTALLTRLDDAQTKLLVAERRHERAVAALAEAPVPPPAAPLRQAIEAAKGVGEIDVALAEAERDLAGVVRQVAAALAALDLWDGDADGLASCRLPMPAAAEETALRLEAARAALDLARRGVAEDGAEIAALDAELLVLAQGRDTVPTREVIAAQRARRDAAWRAIRRGIEDGAPTDGALADGFETLRDTADRLADERAEDAERVNAYATKAARRALLRDRRAGTEAAAEAAAAECAAAEAAWAALWAPAGLVPRSPAAMREWRAAREKVLELVSRGAELRRRRDAVAARRDAACALLAAWLPGATALAPLLARAGTLCAGMEAAEAAHRALRDAAAKEDAAAEEARAARDAAASDLARDGEAWRPALAALGLGEAAGLEDVETALAAWAAVAEAATAWGAADRRIAEMEAAVEALARATATLAERLGETVRDEAPAVTASRLAHRLAEARGVEAEARGLTRQVLDRRKAAEAAQDAHRAAGIELARLHAAAGTAEIAALEDAVRRAAERARLRAEIAREAAALEAQGDGLPEAELLAEIEGFDPDAAAVRMQEIEARTTELNDRRTGLGAERQRVESLLAAMETGRDAAGLAQDARQALAEAQAAGERYARLHVARTLLKAGIERLRQSQQGPMLTAATHHFALLTGGRYVRLVTDEDDDGQPVLRALRDDGTACPMDQLSEGARDQLFLALRVAALEGQAEPLPFIADDLLASFDETRAAAALQLLAGLGRRVQTILFTHHAHVARLAEGVTGASVLRLPGTGAAA